MIELKQIKKPFPFWLICVLVLLCSPFIGGFGGSLVTRVMKGGRVWKELPGPSGEKIVAILDAAITINKEHRLCVTTERGMIYLWQKSYRSWGGLDPGGALPDQYWHLLKPLPDKVTIKYLIVSHFDSDGERPLVAAKGENGQTYAWQNDNWHPFVKITVVGVDWPYEWPSNGETKLRRRFRSWFDLPRPPGKVIDETTVSFEGALSWWVSSYVLLEDDRLLVLAAETDVGDVVVELAAAAVAFVAGVILLIILRIRRKRANARRLESVTL